MERINLSIIVPVCNEGKILEKNLTKINEYLKNSRHLNDYEIVVVDNGSTDNSNSILAHIDSVCDSVVSFSLEKRGLGSALKKGILEASKDIVMFMAIDISFGLDIIEKSIGKYFNSYDLVLGSKGHKDSIYEAPLSRKMLSKISNFLIRLIFRINVYDTQGTFLIKRSLLMRFINNLTSSGSWFQTQLVIYACANDSKVCEIPVTYRHGIRKSRMRFKDVIRTFVDLLSESFVFYFKGIV